MKQLTTLFLILILLLSCTSRTIYKKPKGLIDKDKMITIWVDLYIARGAKTVKTKTLRKDINFVPLVLKKYNIDSLQFSESNRYYTSRIDEYEEMFDQVETRLEALRKQYEIKKSKADSIVPLLKEIDIDTTLQKKKLKQQRRLENIMK